MRKQNLVVFMEMFYVFSFQSNYKNQTALKLLCVLQIWSGMQI